MNNLFDLSGKTAVVTGGAGVLCSSMCKELAKAGVKVAVIGLHEERAKNLASELGNGSIGVGCNVFVKKSLVDAAELILGKFRKVDILINGAGGNRPLATTNSDQSFFDLSEDAIKSVLDLNLMGTILSSQVFGSIMARQKEGVILNVSSMTAFRPLTRIVAYSAAKAGLSNFTQWLAVHMAQEYSPEIRVNAIAPGFFVGEQNKRLLYNENDTLTPRGQSIISHTPQKRFGIPDDLLGTMLWLVSPASAFVTGIVVPVDGGFSAFSGV